MNTETKSVAQMTPEEKRIAIAEACPNLFVHVTSPFGPGGLHWIEGQDDNGNKVTPGAHVDPFNDLDAMHEAEKVLTLDQRQDFGRALRNMCDQFDCYEPCGMDWFSVAHATAAQHADAFLMTMEGQ